METTDDSQQADVLVKHKQISEDISEAVMACLKKIEIRQRDCQDKLDVLAKNLYDLHVMVQNIGMVVGETNNRISYF